MYFFMAVKTVFSAITMLFKDRTAAEEFVLRLSSVAGEERQRAGSFFYKCMTEKRKIFVSLRDKQEAIL